MDGWMGDWHNTNSLCYSPILAGHEIYQFLSHIYPRQWLIRIKYSVPLLRNHEQK